MCRWFAYVSSSEPCLLEDVLVTPAHALSKQVHEHYLPQLLSHDPSIHAEPTTEAEITTRNRLFNVDGFGMAWYTSTISAFSSTKTVPQPELYPALYKNIQPPLHDSNFRSICRNTCSKVVFAHIRAATATAITPTNNHPFTFGIHTIMHNGYISHFPKIKRNMCQAMSQAAYESIEGGTDTEHFAALLMSFLCPDTSNRSDMLPAWEEYHSPSQIKEALQQTISKIISLQDETLGSRAEPNDLNIAVTDGKVLVASRFRNHATEQPPSLYYSTQAGVTLNRQFPDHPDGKEGPHGSAEKHGHVKKPAKGAEGHNPHAQRDAEEHGRHVIIASEPTTYKNKEWNLIEKNRVVLVDRDGNVDIEEM